jgi:hypothetical protein
VYIIYIFTMSSSLSEEIGVQGTTDNTLKHNEKGDVISVHEASHGSVNPPNGGLVAWIQVAAAFCLFFNTWYA